MTINSVFCNSVYSMNSKILYLNISKKWEILWDILNRTLRMGRILTSSLRGEVSRLDCIGLHNGLSDRPTIKHTI